MRNPANYSRGERAAYLRLLKQNDVHPRPMTSRERAKGGAIVYEQTLWWAPSRAMVHLRARWELGFDIDLLHCGKRES